MRLLLLFPCLSAVLGLACASRQLPVPESSTLTIGLGYGGTSRTPALNSFLDSLVAESLLTMGWDGRPQPKLAVKWQWADAATTLRLDLKQGVVFHDGTPLTAAIVADDLRRRMAQGGFRRVKAVEPGGAHQITIRLSEPDAFLIDELYGVNIKKDAGSALGTGPFVLRSQQPQVVLEAFSRYHQGQPLVPRIRVRTYDTPRASWAAMMRGDIEFLYEANRDAVGFVEAASRIRTFSFPRPYYIPIVFNIKHPVLGRREVRQAINGAIDRAEIVDKALHGLGEPADGPVWPSHWAYNRAARSYSYNAEAARLRLDAAGLPVVDAGKAGMPRRFTFRCLFWSEDPEFERIALVVQKQLYEIGIDAQMVPGTLLEISERNARGDFEALIVPMVSSRTLDWVYRFWRSPLPGEQAYSRSGYTAADPVLERIRAAQSDEETRVAVADLQRILHDDPPAAFLVRPHTARAVVDSFVVPGESGRDILGTLWQWQPRAARLSVAR